MNEELATAALKASPPATVSAVTLFGFPLPDIVLVLTAVYTVLQIFFLLREKLRARKEKSEDDADA